MMKGKKIYSRIVGWENCLRHPFLLLIRLYWGILLIQTGFGKWINFSEVTSFFAKLHLPLPIVAAICVATLEVVGGISLVLGFLSRIFSALLVIMFSVAYITAHKEIFSHPSKFISEPPFLFLYTSLIILCFGSGYFSLDYLLEKKNFKNPL